MARPLAQRLALCALVVALALASVLSAIRMAPGATGPLALTGPAFADAAEGAICGDLPAVHEHRCDFCRLLDAPPRLVIAPRAERLACNLAGWALADLIPAAYGGNPHITARAPPQSA